MHYSFLVESTVKKFNGKFSGSQERKFYGNGVNLHEISHGTIPFSNFELRISSNAIQGMSKNSFLGNDFGSDGPPLAINFTLELELDKNLIIIRRSKFSQFLSSLKKSKIERIYKFQGPDSLIELIKSNDLIVEYLNQLKLSITGITSGFETKIKLQPFDKFLKPQMVERMVLIMKEIGFIMIKYNA